MLIRAAALIEGLRLEAPITLQPFVVARVSPERKFIGRDGRGIFNAELADAGFVTSVDQPTWAAQLWPRRQLALAVSSPVEGEAHTMPLVLALVAGRMTDVLALSHGGDPRVYVSAFELSDDGATWRTAGVMLGEGPYPGSTLDRLADGRGLAALDPAVVWCTAPSNLRLSLWLSLYRGAAAEREWDARMFRLFALLEAMAGEVFPRPVPVLDADGAPF